MYFDVLSWVHFYRDDKPVDDKLAIPRCFFFVFFFFFFFFFFFVFFYSKSRNDDAINFEKSENTNDAGAK